MTMATHEDYIDFANVAMPSDRKFGLTVGAIMMGIGALRWALGHGGTFSIALLSIGGVLFVLGATFPSVLGMLNRAWMAMGSILARITSPVIMLLMFLLLFTPIAIGMRLAGRDILGLRRKGAGESYWKVRSDTRPDAESLRMQF